MPSCFNCGKEIVVTDRVGRRDSCVCGADLHCCKNCEFYDPTAYNECREPQAERVLEKAQANFCDYFQISTKPRAGTGKGAVQEAKQKLEALFKKK